VPRQPTAVESYYTLTHRALQGSDNKVRYFSSRTGLSSVPV
jgi:hypothetical protein